MMIRSIPTFHCYPSQSLLKAHLHLHAQASSITTPSTNHTIRTSYDNSRFVRWSGNQTAEGSVSAAIELESAANVVRKFYDGINRRDLASVEDIIALNCVYEDLIFSRPFVGRKVIKFLNFKNFLIRT